MMLTSSKPLILASPKRLGENSLNTRKWEKGSKRYYEKGKLEGTRELVFSKLRYIVVYEVREDVVNLIRIQHTSQKRD